MRLRWVIVTLVLATLFAAPALRAATDPAATCAAAKRKAVGKKALDRMRCEATAAIRGALDPHCLEQAEERFDRSFAKAELPGRCLTVGDADALELQVDGFVARALVALSETTSTTTTTTTSTTTTSTTTTTTIPPPCPGGGEQLSDRAGSQHCWYLGGKGADCDTTCAMVGRIYDPATETFGGSGGDDTDCVVLHLAFPGALGTLMPSGLKAPSQDCSTSGLGGLGCFRKFSSQLCNPFDIWGPSCTVISSGRCASPSTNSTASAPDYARFCACQ
jgi:hypothetical protein